ncbi:MAG TPA: hypothetical protein PLL57_08760 [Flavobacteriales bacterium]|nr:hypothetical protein [Flavobacteriales bacterium]
MSYEEVNSQVLGFLREELDKCGWYERFVFRFRGSVVRLLIDGSVARMLSGWELDNLMEFLLQARVLHVGLLSENEGGDQRPNTEQVFLKWPDRIEWKKTIVQSVSLRYSR